MNILVTGGAGYIGSYFIKQLIKQSDANIIVADIFLQGKDNILKNKRISYLEADIRDYKAMRKIFQSHPIDAVVHFAAIANVPDSIKRPLDYYETNITGSLNVLRCMRETNVQKIIFSSSAAVYGEPIEKEISEGHPKKPINPYGFSKLVFETILEDCHKAQGLNSISFRYFCAAGADEEHEIGERHEPETHVIPALFQTALGKRDIFSVYGNDFPTPDGTGVRDYIHVNDLAAAHVLALKMLKNKTAPVCQVYNLGINHGYSVMELLQAAEKISGKKIPYAIKPRRPGDPAILVAKADKAVRELGWKPAFTDIESILQSAWQFFSKNI